MSTLAGLKRRVGRMTFLRLTSGIFDTPPVRLQSGNGFAVLSQLQHSDVQMYLLAIKSFCARVRPSEIYVLNDGTLTSDDLSILRRHLPGHHLLNIADHRSKRCPQGGTWERLLAISSLVGDRYVVQLDADTLAIQDLPEVASCIAQSRAFAIGTWDGQQPETMQARLDVASKLATVPNAHVQVIAEAHLNRLAGYESMRYIRGCSGFAGLPPGSFSRSTVEQISEQMTLALGTRWSEWGTEQFVSNVIVANTSDPMVLPHPKYCDCTQLRGDPAFVHFIGTCRFDRLLYGKMGARIAAELSREGRSPRHSPDIDREWV